MKITMSSESTSSNLEITDEEFQRIRLCLYQSSISQMEKIAKMILNVADNLTATGSNINKDVDKILNVIEKTDFLMEESCGVHTETMEATAS